MPSGGTVATLNLATSEAWKDQSTGQQQERTEWHRVVLYRKLGEIAGEYLRKGSKVYLEGRLRTRQWEDQSGQRRYSTEIIGDEMQMLDSRPSDGGGRPQQQRSQPQQHGARQQGQDGPVDFYDDDVPF